MRYPYIFLAAGNGLVVVLLGAFGAHALKNLLDPAALEVWRTAVQYQMFHVAALIAIQFLARDTALQPALGLVGCLFMAGIILFCGSLYLLALSGMNWLGVVTPFGGLCFLAGWGQLARLCFVKTNDD